MERLYLRLSELNKQCLIMDALNNAMVLLQSSVFKLIIVLKSETCTHPLQFLGLFSDEVNWGYQKIPLCLPHIQFTCHEK